jgi:AraC-like DNA-binding protein
MLNERKFEARLNEALVRHYTDNRFRITHLAEKLAMSERQLRRKTRILTGHGPSEYLTNFRLDKSLELLRRGTRIGEVAQAVGFSSHAYFSSCFRMRYGKTPSRYRKEKMERTRRDDLHSSPGSFDRGLDYSETPSRMVAGPESLSKY